MRSWAIAAAREFLGIEVLSCGHRLFEEREKMSNKMWGGRFATGPGAIMEEINASIGFDFRLARQDIEGSRAHVAMLAKTGVVEPEDAQAISSGLDEIGREIEAGEFKFLRALGDIHMNIETRLPAAN